MDKKVKVDAAYKEFRRTRKPMEWEKARGPEYWEYRKKWEEYPKKMQVSDFPIHLDIETTNACNLACPMCPRTIMISRGTFRKIGQMDFNFYKSLIDQAAAEGVCSVKLQYLGEPLLHPDISRQIRYAKKKGIIEVMINTNAVLLSEKMSREILEAGIDSIFFSVDTLDEEKYRKIRVGSDLESVLKNIKTFMRIKEKLGCRHVQTRVSKVVMPEDTPRELEKFKNFWFNEVKVDLVGFDELVDFTSSTEQINSGFVCAQPFQRMVILWDGRVLPCCGDVYAEYVLGDARDKTLKDIWHGSKFQKLRDKHLAGKYYEVNICKKCYLPRAQWERG